MLTINVVTLFPEVFEGPLRVSILGRAAEGGRVRYRVVRLGDYTHGRHKTVDGPPYGGGAGMVLKPEPFFEAVEDLRTGPPIVLLSARGRPFGHRDAVRFAVGQQLTLLCGHYKDVDQRVADGLGAEGLSVGDFGLSGGEPAAPCGLDSVGRVREGAKERGRASEGIGIARRGAGINATFTVRKISAGVGVERIFPLHAPSIAEIELVRKGRVRRAKLYFLRRLAGKAARIREKRGPTGPQTAEKQEA